MPGRMPHPAKRRRKPLSDTSEKNTVSGGDPIRREWEELAKIVAPCLGCTACSSSCPVFQSDREKNPRKIIRELGRGRHDGILDAVDIWWCGGCYACEAHCPQGVPLTRVLFRLKNRAVRTGRSIPGSITRTAEALRTGTVVPVSDAIRKKREALGLPLPPECSTGEIETILKAARLSDKAKPSK